MAILGLVGYSGLHMSVLVKEPALFVIWYYSIAHKACLSPLPSSALRVVFVVKVSPFCELICGYGFYLNKGWGCLLMVRFVTFLEVCRSKLLGSLGLGVTVLLSACTTQRCDPTGAMAAHCAPVKMHVWTGEAFEQDKMFYYRDESENSRRVRDIPPTALAPQVLKGQQDYYKVWSQDGRELKAVFVQRPNSF